MYIRRTQQFLQVPVIYSSFVRQLRQCLLTGGNSKGARAVYCQTSSKAKGIPVLWAFESLTNGDEIYREV